MAGSHVSERRSRRVRASATVPGEHRSSGSAPGRLRRLLSSLPVAALVLNGCASISEKDCLRGDWQTLGFEDGRAGLSSERLASYADDCGDYDVRPDPQRYQAGYDVGIRQYCTVDNGLDQGESNADYEGICPADVQPAFIDGYLRGLELARENLELAYERLQLDLDNARDERNDDDIGEGLDDLEDDIDILQSRLSSNSFEREAINRKIARWSQPL